MQEYIFQGHTSKLSKTEAKRTTSTENYLSHHEDKNINKPDKIRIVFDASAKIQYESLNKHLLKGPDYLNNLRFRQRKYAVMVDITQWSWCTKVFMYSFLAKQTLQVVWTGFSERLLLMIVKNLMYILPIQF